MKIQTNGSLLVSEMPASPWLTPPCTMEQRLERIEAMGRRVDGYIRFMCEVGNLGGSSAEAKDRAVADFYERLVMLEGHLGRIQQDFQLE